MITLIDFDCGTICEANDSESSEFILQLKMFQFELDSP